MLCWACTGGLQTPILWLPPIYDMVPLILTPQERTFRSRGCCSPQGETPAVCQGKVQPYYYCHSYSGDGVSKLAKAWEGGGASIWELVERRRCIS